MGKQRARATRQGHQYTPTKTVNYETLVKQLFIEKYFGYKPFEGQVFMTVKAYFSVPKSTSKKRKQMMLDGKIRPIKKPDWDNVGKIVSDALNMIAYLDDKQIIDCTVSKFYSDRPRVEVAIEGEEGSA